METKQLDNEQYFGTPTVVLVVAAYSMCVGFLMGYIIAL